MRACVLRQSPRLGASRLYPSATSWRIGIREDPEKILLPLSLRNTVSTGIKEEPTRRPSISTPRYSFKDYYIVAGDYSYVKVEHEQAWRANDSLKLGFLLGMKKVDFPEPDADGWVKDCLSLPAGPTTADTFVGRTKIDASLSALGHCGKRLPVLPDIWCVHGCELAAFGLDSLGRYRREFRLSFDQAKLTWRGWRTTRCLTLTWDTLK